MRTLGSMTFSTRDGGGSSRHKRRASFADVVAVSAIFGGRRTWRPGHARRRVPSITAATCLGRAALRPRSRPRKHRRSERATTHPRHAPRSSGVIAAARLCTSEERRLRAVDLALVATPREHEGSIPTTTPTTTAKRTTATRRGASVDRPPCDRGRGRSPRSALRAPDPSRGGEERRHAEPQSCLGRPPRPALSPPPSPVRVGDR